MSQLANQIAVVTGAGRGIGRAIALKFAAEGADVVCVSRTAENSEKVAGEVRALGRRAWAYAVDVADASAVEAACARILAEAGRVDVLVNNAGVTRDGLLMRMSEADWDTVLDTNLKGAFLFTKGFSASPDQTALGPHHQRRLGHWADRQCRPVQLCRQQGGADWVHQVRRPRIRARAASPPMPSPRVHRDGHDRRLEARSSAREILKSIPLTASASLRTSPTPPCSWPARRRAISPARF